MVIKVKSSRQEDIQEASNYTEMDAFLDIMCCNADCYNESVISDIKRDVLNVADLYKQWKNSAGNMIEHKWIFRYITPEQKERLEKHYDVLKSENVNYSTYKKSFNFISKFMGLPSDSIILENVVIKKDGRDKNQDVIHVKYSKGKIKVNIPDGVRLMHVRAEEDGNHIDHLIPSFRSRVVGKYMYPSKRCYFTCIKAINPGKAGFEGKTNFNKYTPKTPIKTAYIDPACADFGNNAVYVETETPIPVERLSSFFERLFKNKKDGDNE